ncbi:uncharacterized protein FSUBG_5915 [Fusarium subglutinans]|uniref:Uncharacterized protein n=1 Tax=Gibberella subglutinans TaxID=42677 RepID=A0A8H5Q2P5_GIBSU|nr:uncharacterized protein FSUBG_5915 [Fusarium subglutinans]KAF5606518.1 hypothetical protein FSUBG_5915 [Fusarium subglutinans]
MGENIGEERDYFEGFLSQCFPRENTEDTKKLLRKDATVIAANLLIKGGTITTSVSRFAWEADKLIKKYAVLGLPPQSKPAWPWSRPPTEKNGKQLSTVFATLKEDHDREGKLDINRESVPKEVEHQAALEVPVGNGVHEPLPHPGEVSYEKISEDIQAEVEKELKAMKDAINEILDRKDTEQATLLAFTEWSIDGEGDCWSPYTRIGMAGEIWQERIEAPEEKFRVSMMMSGLRKLVESGDLPNYELCMK